MSGVSGQISGAGEMTRLQAIDEWQRRINIDWQLSIPDASVTEGKAVGRRTTSAIINLVNWRRMGDQDDGDRGAEMRAKSGWFGGLASRRG
jgi:hypothetical protein